MDLSVCHPETERQFKETLIFKILQLLHAAYLRIFSGASMVGELPLGRR